MIWYLNCFQFNNGTSSTCRREHGTYRDLNTTSNSIEGQDILNITTSLNISSNYTTTEKNLNNLLWNRGINIQKTVGTVFSCQMYALVYHMVGLRDRN